MLKIGLIMQKIPFLLYDFLPVIAVMLHYYFVDGISYKTFHPVNLDDQEITF